MKALAVLTAAVATALLVAALVQAADLKKRMEALPAPAADAPVAQTAAELPPSPWEMAELARRVDALSARLDAKIAREEKGMKEAGERFTSLRERTGGTLAGLDVESAAVKKEIGDKGADKEKVAALTRRIRTEQQKALIKRFMTMQFEAEYAKLKAELALTPEQQEQFDRVGDEAMEKMATLGSSFMDGEGNPAEFQKLQTETNEKMGAILNEEQMGKFKSWTDSRMGGRRGGQNPQGQEGPAK